MFSPHPLTLLCGCVPCCAVSLDGKCGAHGGFNGNAPPPPPAVAASAAIATENLLDTVRSAVPSNILGAAVGDNILGVITTSLAIGAAVASIQPASAAAPLVALIHAASAVVEKLTAVAVTFIPIGVCSLVASKVAAACDPVGTLSALAAYVAVYLLGLTLHAFVVLPGLFTFATRGCSPWRILRGAAPAMMTGFACDSSAASLPVTKKCALALGVPQCLVDFSLPLGATVNMNGTALYEAATALFIAQLHGVPLGLGGAVTVAVVSTIAAVGAAAIPSAGLFTLLAVLQATGLGQYSADIGCDAMLTLLPAPFCVTHRVSCIVVDRFIAALDWFLGRCRTAVNIQGDVFAAAAVTEWRRRKSNRRGGNAGIATGRYVALVE